MCVQPLPLLVNSLMKMARFFCTLAARLQHACSTLAARLQNKRVFGTLLACGWVQQIAFRTHVERAAHTLSVQLVGSVQVK